LSAYVMHREDIGMIQRCNRAGLLIEPAKAIRFTSEGLRQNLDCDFPSQASIASAIHFPHSARANRVRDFVGTEFGSRSQGHG
jgi:hypothetical protein